MRALPERSYRRQRASSFLSSARALDARKRRRPALASAEPALADSCQRLARGSRGDRAQARGADSRLVSAHPSEATVTGADNREVGR